MADISGDLVNTGLPLNLTNNVEMVEHDAGRHAAAPPVVNPLLIAAPIGQAKTLGEGLVAPSGIDQSARFVFVHSAITHHVYQKCNIACNHIPFSGGKLSK